MSDFEGGSIDKRDRVHHCRANRMRKTQLALGLRFWGGKRKGAGRKPAGERAGVSHRRTLRVTKNTAVHVTVKLLRGVADLRGKRFAALAELAIRRCAERDGFRVIEYSIQHDHPHLMIEADAPRSLASGMRALGVSLAKRINRTRGQSGQVLKERYHARTLKSGREIFLALRYILGNSRKHIAQAGRSVAKGWIDPWSSGRSFDGWRGRAPSAERMLPRASGWLLLVGWRLQQGPLDVDAIPR